MLYRKKQCLPREQDAPTAVPRNKNNYNARPLQCTTTKIIYQNLIGIYCRNYLFFLTCLTYKFVEAWEFF